MNDTPAIEIKGLTYTYGRAEAVHGFDLTVPRGRCYGLFGRNGAGKTTTMKCLLNLLRPRKGTLRVFGMDPNKNEVGEVTAGLRAGCGGVLSVDVGAGNAGLSGIVSDEVESGD